MKYKVGDRVRVVKNKTGHSYSIGRIVTIKELRDKEYLCKEFEGGCAWTVTDSEIEPEHKIKKDPIVKRVIKQFKQRSKVGIKKYGTTLEENNTDDFLQHLKEELMDATLYIEKLQSKIKHLKSLEL